MHYICEIVIPPGYNVESGVKQVMNHFRKEDEEQADFWDWYVIGGRWSGHKQKARLSPEAKKAFYEELETLKVTVSGIVFGKQTLKPESQIPIVDALWRKHFPGMGDVCLFFSHSGTDNEDVCTVAQVPESLICARLIVAKPHWDDKNKLEAGFMRTCDIWNGCNYEKTSFDGNVKKALQEIMQAGEDDYPANIVKITDDWQVVTVDYHN